MADEEKLASTQQAPQWTPEQARALALEAGFDNAGLVALPHTEAERDASRFATWIDAGRAGSMQYLERRDDAGALLRQRVQTPFPWARSVLVCFAVYNSDAPRSIEPAPPNAAWIARYAWTSRTDERGERRPSDYHKVLLKRLRLLEARLHHQLGDFESRAFVDTGPVVERSLATAAGLGWTGKNTCLIHPKLGSFAFLGVLLTSLEAQPKSGRAELPDRCGSCTRCIQACPTQALTPYQMDATRCISYLTIEHRGQIVPGLMAGMGRQVFGCDICQDVCPWNRKAPITSDAEMAARAELVNPALEWLAAMDEAEWERTFNGSPVRRAGYFGLLRNVAIAAGNTGAVELVPQLRHWADAADTGLHTAARWALKKLTLIGESRKGK
jgi:epoxyqueuosine reductase